MENALPNSKSDTFTQKHSPAEQKEWVIEQLKVFKDKTIAVVPGNHEYNRTTKMSGLYPLYDCCLLAGIGDKYRDTIAFIDIGVGTSKKASKKQVHYFGQIQHKAKDIKAVHSSDYTDGIDFFASGHDHEAKDKPRAKLVFDKHNKVIFKRNIECINCGRCAKVCPMKLAPNYILRSSHIPGENIAKQLSAGMCIFCGACSYICPSRLPLMAKIREYNTALVEGKLI